MSRNGMARVRERFQWKDVAARIDALYDEVIEQDTEDVDAVSSEAMTMRHHVPGAARVGIGRPAELIV